MSFTIINKDITKMKTDVIVNAANTSLLKGGGVCGAIFRAAGIDDLQDECNKIGHVDTGKAVITPGFNLSKYIIHTAGPIYDPAKHDECKSLLESCYRESLMLAFNNDCHSISFPLISAGIYGYPKHEAYHIATSIITDFINDYDMDVYLCLIDFEIDTDKDLNDYLKIVYKPIIKKTSTKTNATNSIAKSKDVIDKAPTTILGILKSFKNALYEEDDTLSLPDIFDDMDEPFSTYLFKLIDSKGKTDVEVYKKANIDRKLFSKIRSNTNYIPRKKTILALAISLELNLEETEKLLEIAGYALSHASRFDVIVEYYIIHKEYNIYKINETLFAYDESLLGS